MKNPLLYPPCLCPPYSSYSYPPLLLPCCKQRQKYMGGGGVVVTREELSPFTPLPLLPLVAKPQRKLGAVRGAKKKAPAI